MKVIFEINDIQVAENNDVADNQPRQIEIEVPEDWVQLTYEGLRTAPNGDDLAFFGENGWWNYKGMKFSDVIIVEGKGR
jgi:hypothetical protein